jgi:hypothetical protein
MPDRQRLIARATEHLDKSNAVRMDDGHATLCALQGIGYALVAIATKEEG